MVWNTVRTLYAYIIEILFPPSRRAQKVRAIEALSVRIRQSALGMHTLTTLLSYHEPTTKDAVQAAKFEHDASALTLLSNALDEYLIELATEHALTDGTRVIVTVVPLGKKRLRERGYNQVDVVLRGTRAVQQAFVDYQPEMLVRTHETQPQTSLTRTKRARNVKGAFACTRDIPHGSHLLIIDDVVTTGATLRSAAAACKKAAKSSVCISLLAFARA